MALGTAVSGAIYLAREGKVNRQGLPNALQLMVLAQIADRCVPGVPPSIFKLIIDLPGTIVRWFGYRESYVVPPDQSG